MKIEELEVGDVLELVESEVPEDLLPFHAAQERIVVGIDRENKILELAAKEAIEWPMLFLFDDGLFFDGGAFFQIRGIQKGKGA